MYTLDNISVYILNWKKVSNNSLILYDKIHPIIENTCIINCDESLIIKDNIPHIQLDDSHYYGSQYNHSIKHVKDDNILCVIVGDNIPNNNFSEIFQSALKTFNSINVGVYAPHDKRSVHQTKLKNISENLYNVSTTDCGFWFIHPKIVKKLKNIDYNISKYGWGIDVITAKEAVKQKFLVVRDYSIETDQLDHTQGYDAVKAKDDWAKLENIYKSSFF
jgi:hypothetical protein